MIQISQYGPGRYRSNQPQTEQDFDAIVNLGITRILDLENEPGESVWEEIRCERHGIKLLSFPMSGFWGDRKQLRKALRELRTTFYPGSLLVHCLHGQDRTGLIVGLDKGQTYGMGKVLAWSEMLDHGFHPILLGLTYLFWTE